MRRHRYYIHKVQAWLCLGLFTYCLLFFCLAYVTPFIPPALTLGSDLPLAERVEAAQRFLLLSQTVWPGLLAIVLGAVLVSLLLTHRLAGPIFRLEESAKELQEGNLALRIRLRKKDQLQELADLLNQAIIHLDHTLLQIRARHAQLHAGLAALEEQSLPVLSGHPALLDRVVSLKKDSGHITDLLARFRLSDEQP